MSQAARRQTGSLPYLSLVALAVILALPPRVDAQVLYGSILGDVRDASDAAIQGAEVAVVNSGTGLERRSATDSVGRFNFADLPAGTKPLDDLVWPERGTRQQTPRP